MLPLRRLGHTNMMFSPLGLGTWQFGDAGKGANGIWKSLTHQDVLDIMTTSVQGGINWIDTAEVYGSGVSERAISRGIAAMIENGTMPRDLYLADKWWPLFNFASSMNNHIARQLKDLGATSIDLYQIHQPYSFSTIQSQAAVLAALHENELIEAAGVSNFSAKAMAKMDDCLRENGMRLASNQVRYNLLDRSIEKNGILQEAKDRGISIIAYSPLQQGVLTGRFHENMNSLNAVSQVRKSYSHINRKMLEKTAPVIEALKDIALTYDRTPAQVALNWLLVAQGETVFAIPGATKASQAQSNVAAMTFELTEDDVARLNEASAQLS